MAKGNGWIAMQTAVMAVSVIVSIVVSITAYQVQDPARLDALELRAELETQRCTHAHQRIDALTRQLEANARPRPWAHPGRIGAAE